MDWLNGFVSASFSVARCRRPTCGSAFWITSPSSSSTRRSTPCAAGCCGPKFNVKLRISAMRVGPHRHVLQRRFVAIVLADDTRHERARLDADRLIHDTSLRGIVLDLHVADQREVLAERMADEAVVRQQAAQVWVIVEEDAEQI